MRIEELEGNCDKCQLFDLCEDKASNLCLCINPQLYDLTEEEYLQKAESICAEQKKNLSNEMIMKSIANQKTIFQN